MQLGMHDNLPIMGENNPNPFNRPIIKFNPMSSSDITRF